MKRKNYYKKISFLIIAFAMAFCFSVKAQSTDNHFIYIQAKNKQPFYVILNKKVYSSSTIGYLIIPKLKNGSYDLKIGFPKQSADEKQFKCVVNDADVGYSLQNNDNGDLGLLDLQSQNFIAAANNTGNDNTNTVAANIDNTANQATAKVSEDTQKKSAAFGDMLTSVANDSTLIQKPVVQQAKAEMPKQDEAVTTTPTIQSDNFGNNPQADAKAVIASSDEKNLKPANIGTDDQTYGVIKSSENATDAGQKMTFVLFNSRSTDTVQIVIPQTTGNNNIDNSSSQQTTTPQANTKQYGDKSLALFTNSDGDTVPSDGSSSSNTTASQKKKKKKTETLNNDSSANTDTANNVNNPFYNGSSNNTSNNNVSNDAATTTSTPPCDNPLSDKDLQKTQKKMIGKGNDDDMLSVADKAIKGKCVTTQQVKQLGSIFLSDAGRFALYQDVYPYVSDKNNYNTLQNQLLDTYFKNRFLDMLKNQ